MANISSIKIGSTTYTIRDATKLDISFEFDPNTGELNIVTQ